MQGDVEDIIIFTRILTGYKSNTIPGDRGALVN
jgi:hypothetical protein